MAIFGTKESEKKDETGKPAASSAAAAGVKVPTVLLQPRVSEKAGHLISLNKYVFKVRLAANKVEIKKAVENAYKVKVVQVNIVRNQGKSRNFGRTAGRTSPFKKAIVTLKAGDKIEGTVETV